MFHGQCVCVLDRYLFFCRTGDTGNIFTEILIILIMAISNGSVVAFRCFFFFVEGCASLILTVH